MDEFDFKYFNSNFGNYYLKQLHSHIANQKYNISDVE
jgi:hypothetical protein